MRVARLSWAFSAAALAVMGGCSNGPQRTLDRDAVAVVDTGQPDTGAMDSGVDAGDASDGAADSEVSDARADRVDGSSDASADAATDIPVESSVVGCMSNMDCGSAALYCNASTCGARGYCTPRPDTVSCDSDAGPSEIVCGCNGMSYPTLCALQAAGVRLVAFGMCARD